MDASSIYNNSSSLLLPLKLTFWCSDRDERTGKMAVVSSCLDNYSTLALLSKVHCVHEKTTGANRTLTSTSKLFRAPLRCQLTFLLLIE